MRAAIRHIIVSTALIASTAQASATWAGEGRSWTEVRTEHFVISHHPEQEKLAVDIVRMAEPERARIVSDLGRGGDVRVEVRLTLGPADFQAAQPEGYVAPVWSSGLAYPSLKLIVLQARGGPGGGPAVLQATFRHELSHLMLYQALGGRRAPRWLAEGMAMYHAAQWEFSRAMAVTRAIAFRNLIPLKDLEAAFPDKTPDVHLAYAEAIDFVSYLFGRFGRDGMNRFIGRLAGGDSVEAAAREAFGSSMGEVEKAWLSRLRWYYAWIPLISSSATLWFVVSVIFVLGCLRRRAQNKRRLRRMEEEELLLSSIAHDYSAPARVTKRKGNGGDDEWPDKKNGWVH